MSFEDPLLKGVDLDGSIERFIELQPIEKRDKLYQGNKSSPVRPLTWVLDFEKMKRNFLLEKTAEQLEQQERAAAVAVPLKSISETYSSILKSRKGFLIGY